MCKPKFLYLCTVVTLSWKLRVELEHFRGFLGRLPTYYQIHQEGIAIMLSHYRMLFYLLRYFCRLDLRDCYRQARGALCNRYLEGESNALPTRCLG